MYDLNWSRKADSWDQVRADERALNLAMGLMVYTAEHTPNHCYAGDVRGEHVVQTADGRLFFVDPQGYDYARYAVLIPGLRINVAGPQATLDSFGRLVVTMQSTPEPKFQTGDVVRVNHGVVGVVINTDTEVGRLFRREWSNVHNPKSIYFIAIKNSTLGSVYSAPPEKLTLVRRA